MKCFFELQEIANAFYDQLVHIYYNLDFYQDFLDKQIRKVCYYGDFFIENNLMEIERAKWTNMFLTNISNQFLGRRALVHL